MNGHDDRQDDQQDEIGYALGSVLLYLARLAAKRWAAGDEVEALRLWRAAVRLRGDAEFVDGLPATTPDDREADR